MKIRKKDIELPAFQLALEISPNGVLLSDSKGRIVTLNHSLLQMFGYPKKEDLVGSPIEVLIPERLRKGHVHSRTDFSKDPHARLMGRGRDLVGVKKNGVEFPIEIGLSPVETDNGLMVLATHIDITERKRLEQALIEEKTACDKVRQELEDFAHTVSHDLKAPLRGIAHVVDWLCEDFSGRANPEQTQNLDLARKRILRMDNLIDGILEYSRVGRVDTLKEEVDLGALVQEIIDSLARPKNVTLRVSRPLPILFCVRTQMEQTFQNLIQNAITHMDKPKGHIEIGARENPNEWIFFVKDNGPGIPKEYFEKIFQIFQTLKSGNGSETVGVGLSIVKKIAGMNGGRVWCESTLGQGSTFYVAFPKKGQR